MIAKRKKDLPRGEEEQAYIPQEKGGSSTIEEGPQAVTNKILGTYTW